jgi:hypothetical protein
MVTVLNLEPLLNTDGTESEIYVVVYYVQELGFNKFIASIEGFIKLLAKRGAAHHTGE